MYNLLLSKALIGMQSLHILQHVLYVEPCIRPELCLECVLAAQAAVPQAASMYVMMYHLQATTESPTQVDTSSAQHAHVMLRSYTTDLCVTPAHLKPCK